MFGNVVDERKLVTEAKAQLLPELLASIDRAVESLRGLLIGKTITVTDLIPGRTFTIKIE